MPPDKTTHNPDEDAIRHAEAAADRATALFAELLQAGATGDLGAVWRRIEAMSDDERRAVLLALIASELDRIDRHVASTFN